MYGLRLVIVGLCLTALAGCERPGTEAVSLTNDHARSGAFIYDTYCFACHDYGAAGAPGMDSLDQWANRLDSGVTGLLTSVEAGLGVMPKKGSCFDCSAQELTAVVEYMLGQLQPH